MTDLQITIRGSVDRQAPGGIADVFEVGLPAGAVPTSWLQGLMAPESQQQAGRVISKFLKPRFVETGHADAIRSFATEARALSRLQVSQRVTPLLGFGTLEPGQIPRRGTLAGRLSESLEAFETEVLETAQSRRVPFLLFGNVPFEWSLLDPFVVGAYELGATPELRLLESVQLTIELLRFFDRARQQCGVYHFDMKLEHVAWRDGRLIVIDWNWSQVLEPGLHETVLYQDLRRLFIRVLYPLLTSRDIDGNVPSSVWGRIGDPDLYPALGSGMLPFTGVERLVDERLRRWLSRGFARTGETYRTHDEAASELESWLAEARASQPLWSQLDGLAARCAELEARLLTLTDEARRLREQSRGASHLQDRQFAAELSRLTRGLARFRAARPVAVTRAERSAAEWGPLAETMVATGQASSEETR